MPEGAQVQVRPLEEKDLEEVVRITRAVTRDKDEGFWREFLRAYLMAEGNLPDALSPSLCQVAVRDGSVVAARRRFQAVRSRGTSPRGVRWRTSPSRSATRAI